MRVDRKYTGTSPGEETHKWWKTTERDFGDIRYQPMQIAIYHFKLSKQGRNSNEIRYNAETDCTEFTNESYYITSSEC